MIDGPGSDEDATRSGEPYDGLRPEDVPDGLADLDDDAVRATQGIDLDAAVGRLEDVLLAQPYDRALPDLDELLDRAGIPAAVLRRDDRAIKALHEAVLARPFSQLDEVIAARVEVELLTLEVEVLSEHLANRDLGVEQLGAAASRLTQVRERLTELRALL